MSLYIYIVNVVIYCCYYYLNFLYTRKLGQYILNRKKCSVCVCLLRHKMTTST